MKTWSTTVLRELITSIETGSRPKGGVTEVLNGIPSVSGEHINRYGEFYWKNLRHIPRDFYLKMKRGHIQNGDILIVKDGATTGKTAMVRGDFPFDEAAINEHVFLVRVDKNRVIPSFVWFFLFSPIGQQQILSTFRGAAIGGIAQDFADHVSVPVPSIEDQERIVRLLDEAVAVRKLRAQADQRTADLIPALFHEMFGDPISNSKCLPTTALCEIAAVERGRFTPRPRNDPSYFGGEYPFIQTGDIAESGGIVTRWKQTLNRKGANVSREFPARTVVIAIVGATIGETAILGAPMFCTDSVVGIQPMPERTTPEYIWAALTHWRPIFLTQAPETARANINLGILKPLKIPLPPLTAQKEFSAHVVEIRKMEAEQAASRRRLDDLFQSMLHRAFNGEL